MLDAPAHHDTDGPAPDTDGVLAGGPGALSAVGLKKTYGKRLVVDGVSMGLKRGEIVGLLGPNGAGKTTAFYMIIGLVQADAGTVVLEGQDVSRLPLYQRARHGIGYLAQESSIFRGLSVEDNIAGVLEVVEPDKARRKAELAALLEEFHIAHLAKATSMSLSGGERRRLEIARALAMRPNFLLLDEPFAGIDPIAVRDIQALVRHLASRDVGILITDHNVRETLGLVDRAYVIHAGRVLANGSPAEIVDNTAVRDVYLGDEFRI